MVVMHASESGAERRNRFVRAAYRPELFLLADGENILQSPGLRRHFRLHGVIHSEAISAASEYRGIIQGTVGSGKGCHWRIRCRASSRRPRRSWRRTWGAVYRSVSSASCRPARRRSLPVPVGRCETRGQIIRRHGRALPQEHYLVTHPESNC